MSDEEIDKSVPLLLDLYLQTVIDYYSESISKLYRLHPELFEVYSVPDIPDSSYHCGEIKGIGQVNDLEHIGRITNPIRQKILKAAGYKIEV